eukprot:COSAG04_NODE_3833_length_2486_cov_1.793046_2_plen_94_part_00
MRRKAGASARVHLVSTADPASLAVHLKGSFGLEMLVSSSWSSAKDKNRSSTVATGFDASIVTATTTDSVGGSASPYEAPLSSSSLMATSRVNE